MLGRPESRIMGREVILSGSVQEFIDLLVWIMIQHFHRHRAAGPTYTVFCERKTPIHGLKIMSCFLTSFLRKFNPGWLWGFLNL